ncbi:hypothetical protein IWQ60_009169 [Tieghemiomyces parasiticus]|uniref:ER membrane protein complex subunit 7 beta-sandwich domain-containing protein n=1 Tax=Tieghemiomyces parasiticus TaxID=78921 RepID=A0A9W7ZTZ6_9FUNG|nr:hypothetical protein IWQ60_009169 [Tieghemiomyces parasiticus]
MRSLFALVASSCFAACATVAFRVQGQIYANEVLPDLTGLNPSTRILVDGGAYATWVRQDGQFELDVPPGNWLLEVESKDYVFTKYQLVIRDGDRETVKALPIIPGESWTQEQGKVVRHPLQVQAMGKMDFFTPREGFNIIGMFTSPYMLMMGVTVLLMFVMPKLQASMDPESQKEWEEEKGKLQTQMNSLQAPDVAASLAKWMSPGAAASSSTATSAPAASPAATKAKSKKKKPKS